MFLEDSYSSFGKYKVSAVGEPNGSENFALSFRLSEAYLNLAEAAAHNNDEKTALSTLKTLLENRYEPGKFVEPNGLTGEVLKTSLKMKEEKNSVLRDNVGLILGVMECHKSLIDGENKYTH